MMGTSGGATFARNKSRLTIPIWTTGIHAKASAMLTTVSAVWNVKSMELSTIDRLGLQSTNPSTGDI